MNLFDHLVYLRVFEGCNVQCRHCFIPANPKRMTLDDLARVPEIVASFAKPGQRILLQWHGGEPTLFGANFIAEAIDRIESYTRFHWQHGIQTNLMTFDDSWVDLYHQKFGGEVGVSWDPTIRFFKGSNERFEGVFWPKLAHMIGAGLSPYLVVTATKSLFDVYPNATVLYDKLAEAGVRKVHFERITPTGEARRNWAEVGLSNAEYGAGMSRYLRAYVAWRKTNSGRLHVSPFDGLVEAGRSGEGYGCWSHTCDSSFHTIDASGYKRGCTAITAESDNMRADSSKAIIIQDIRLARSLRQNDCGQCEMRRICSSGCMATPRYDDSGECAGPKGFLKTVVQLSNHFDEVSI